MVFRTIFACLLIAFSASARPMYQEPWGQDSSLACPQRMRETPRRSLGVRLAEVVIDFHQKVISPVDGPRSHFRPSSSQYMRQAMHNYGFIKGFLMGCDRLLRENSEEWIYRKVEEGGEFFKYDPPTIDKY